MEQLFNRRPLSVVIVLVQQLHPVISGINKGSSCGHRMFYSSVVAGAREALVNGVPSISVSLNWKKDGSEDSDFNDAVTVCLPKVNAAIRDIEKGVYPKGFSLDVEIPTSPSANKGLKITKNQAAARFAGSQPALGLNFAQLSRDASAAGAARCFGTQKKNIEVVESVGAAGKSEFKRTVKYFRAEVLMLVSRVVRMFMWRNSSSTTVKTEHLKSSP